MKSTQDLLMDSIKYTKEMLKRAEVKGPLRERLKLLREQYSEATGQEQLV